jgi:hypothetical protein
MKNVLFYSWTTFRCWIQDGGIVVGRALFLAVQGLAGFFFFN